MFRTFQMFYNQIEKKGSKWSPSFVWFGGESKRKTKPHRQTTPQLFVMWLWE